MYENFDIHIGVATDSGYSLSVIDSPAGETDQVTWQPLPEEDPDFSDYVTYLRKLIAKPEDAKALGQILQRFLFPEAIQSLYKRSLEKVRAEGKRGLRVRLRISSDLTRLHQIPWEYCYDGKQFPALNTTTPLVRYPPTAKSPASLAKAETMRILVVMAASPEGYRPLNVKAEERWIRRALSDLEREERVSLRVVDQAGLDTLSSAVVEFRPHIVHFNGHGALKENGEGTLVLQDAQGKAQLAGAEDMMVLLRDRGVGLVILSACQTAVTGSVNALMGVAPGLVSAGIPAAIGMQFDVPEKTAETFMQVLYTHLAARAPLDEAMTEARNRLYFTQKDKVFWGIPVLFMRAPDGLLWQPEALAVRRGVDYDDKRLKPPKHYITRPQISERLQEQLLHGQGAPAVTLLHGMAASGKTTLAGALAQAVWSDYTDGVLWVTLGQKPEVLNQLVDLIGVPGDEGFLPTTVEGASQKLHSLLAERRVLLILDDAWEYEDVAPFLVGGPRCHILVTSRRAGVLGDHRDPPYIYRLRELTESQALTMLAKLLDRTTDPPFSPKERKQALSLANAVGRLPLALELAARRIAGESSNWQEMTEALKAEIGKLEALEPDARRRLKGDLRVEASINLSLDWLRRDFEPAWEALVWLGALPEDSTISTPAAATVWQVKPQKADDILAYLYDENLLLASPAQRIGERSWPAYALHDLVHDVARRRLTADKPQGLGLTLSQANAKFLSRYQERYKELETDGLWQWHKLPDDGYIYGHLANHMAEAGLYDNLHKLVLDQEWRDRQRMVHGDTRSILSDLQLTLRLALDHDDMVNALDCVATYRETAHTTSIIDALYEALNDGDLRRALSLSAIKGPVEDWGRVLTLYLAWEAALADEAVLSREAVEKAGRLRLVQADRLCDGLLVRTALALTGNDPVRAKKELAAFGRKEDSDDLLQCYTPGHPLPSDEEQEILDELVEQIQSLGRGLITGELEEEDDLLTARSTENEMSVQYADVVRPGPEEQADDDAPKFRDQLATVVVSDAGRRLVEYLLQILKTDLYPRYRDVGLIDCGIACLQVRNDQWVREMLRSIIHTGLDREGVVFTFDLPFQLLAASSAQEVHEKKMGNLPTYLWMALSRHDRWGTGLRARSAMAGSLFRRQGRESDARSALEAAEGQPIGFAGYGVLHMLALADRWRELGDSAVGSLSKNRAEKWVSEVQNDLFREDLEKLAGIFNTWWEKETIDTETALAALAEIDDTDTRLVFLEHLSARWASEAEGPNWEGLKALLPEVLVHGTGSFRDAILGRLFGVYLDTHELTDADLIRAIDICEREEMLSMSWAVGDDLRLEEWLAY